ATAQDEPRVHAVLAKSLQCSLPNLMFGQSRHVRRIQAKLSQRRGDVRLAAAVVHVERICLQKAAVTGSGKAKHDFAESDNRGGHVLMISDFRGMISNMRLCQTSDALLCERKVRAAYVFRSFRAFSGPISLDGNVGSQPARTLGE